MAKTITAAQLRDRLHSGGEIAIVDAREEGSFHDRHLLMASSLPLSRVELLAPGLLPRHSAPIVVCDDGEGLAERAALRLIEGGYNDVSVLEGGVEAWEKAGFPVYSGVHVPSKAFAEVVEHECGTPRISVEELAALARYHTHHEHPIGADLKRQLALYAEDLKLVRVMKPSTDPAKYADRIFADVLS